MQFTKSIIFAICVVATATTLDGAEAFVASNNALQQRSPMTTTALQAEKHTNHNNEQQVTTTRRDALVGVMAAFGAAAFARPEPASARYSSYAHREQDWQERQAKGEVQFTSAKQLRAELREIAPMNTEGSKIFCPNGPSAAVSPLMENKCGDKMAIPSVYGRTQDVVGNSIPGFKASATDLNNAGGFPSYK